MIGARWGVSDSEIALRYPCDAFLPAPALQVWRGVTVQAEPEQLWPWLTQVRVAPYSYDWIDNLGRRSPRKLLHLPEPRVGDTYTTAGHRERGRIVAVERGRHLTGKILWAYMSYLLVPREPETTRLLLKVVADINPLLAPALSVGDLVMARRQLLNLKALAEETPSPVER
ncbi:MULTISPECIES: hypothetical protein [Kocuria]|uniref:Polyketide cyclase n=1 Tax=Kocuria rosea subsp. polaris TaxID=136273 RepID=A0A0A6VN95_KOCRO|nr:MULTISPECIES: hypothetical protein [Kocuria]KHD96555.1 polyketide cyclase [Kocuria polaris]WIG18786.1 hypothetical protein QOY29_07680 [Kocuria rosea]